MPCFLLIERNQLERIHPGYVMTSKSKSARASSAFNRLVESLPNSSPSLTFTSVSLPTSGQDAHFETVARKTFHSFSDPRKCSVLSAVTEGAASSEGGENCNKRPRYAGSVSEKWSKVASKYII